MPSPVTGSPTSGSWFSAAEKPPASVAKKGVGNVQSSIDKMGDVPVLGALIDGASLVGGFLMEGLSAVFVFLFGNEDPKNDKPFNVQQAPVQIQLAILKNEDMPLQLKYQASLGLIMHGGHEYTSDIQSKNHAFLKSDDNVLQLLSQMQEVEKPESEIDSDSSALISALKLLASEPIAAVEDGQDISVDVDPGDTF